MCLSLNNNNSYFIAEVLKKNAIRTELYLQRNFMFLNVQKQVRLLSPV